MGLLRGLARTPVRPGSAAAVCQRVARRQARLWQERVDAARDPAGALEGLAILHEQGRLRDEELVAQVRLLGC